jgi:predicted AAA+ superfamily ATPase
VTDQTRRAAPLIPRLIRPRIEAALKDTRVVLLSGPRQAGKTTLASQFANAGRRYFSLDQPALLEFARSDPVGFIRPIDYAIIDEIQRAPELLLAIKHSVDFDTRPGRFLLTGSANLATVPTVADSLAGRMEVIPLLPLAQCEISRERGAFLDALFDEKNLSAFSVWPDSADIIERVTRGGYPDALKRDSQSRRRQWFESYLALIIERDAREVANIDQADKLARLLSVLAEHAGQLVNYSNFGSALGLSSVTAAKYVAILERMFLVSSVRPWFSNRLKRLVKSEKIHFLDGGLLTALRGDEPDAFSETRNRFGPVLESFVYAELVKLAAISDDHYTFSHFRTRDGEEVDLVIEGRRGRVVGVEVKASATVRVGDFKGLKLLQQAAGAKFARGIVLYDGPQVVPFGEALLAVPLSSLWSM